MTLQILLAERDPAVARLVRYCLEGQGHSVTISADGIETLTQAYREPPDLILLDQVLPNLSGRLVCEGLRDDERTRVIPVLVLGDQPDQEWTCTIQGFLRKPFTPGQIMEAVSRFDLARTNSHRGGETP